MEMPKDREEKIKQMLTIYTVIGEMFLLQE